MKPEHDPQKALELILRALDLAVVGIAASDSALIFTDDKLRGSIEGQFCAIERYLSQAADHIHPQCANERPPQG